jgi:hypothetical protein
MTEKDLRPEIKYDASGRPTSVSLYGLENTFELYTRTSDGNFYGGKSYESREGVFNTTNTIGIKMKRISREDLAKVSAPFNLVDILEAHNRAEVERLAKVEVRHEPI